MSTAYIKKLELQGFKSFPERTKILFHPGITAIIGPNGTGKSNIVDGLLWVLGGQRPRAVRGEKTEDIIFNGSTKKAPLGMADVTINLANEPEELVINHRAYRTGEGEYRLDGKVVRLKDIQDELWKRAIGDKEYFVIEQGSIGQFVTSKPQEKRFLLEAAAGTAFYKDKRRQAENKLEDSEQNLTRLEDIIEEVAHARNSLQRQAQAATRYRKLRERIRELTGMHFRRKHLQLEKRQAEVADAFLQFQVREKGSVSLAGSADKDVQVKRKEQWDLEKSMKREQENLFNLKSALARMEADSDKEAKRVEFFEEKKKRALSDQEGLKAELAQLEKEGAEAASALETLTQELSLKQQERTEAEGGTQSLRDKIAALAQTLESLRREYVQGIAAVTEFKNEQAKLDKEVELIARQEERLVERLARERSRLAENEKELQQSAQSRERLGDDLRSTQAKQDERRAALENLHRTIAGLQAAAGTLKEKKDAAAIHLQALSRLAEAERGRSAGEEVPGALGVLADFVEADAETTPLLDILWRDEAKSRLVQARDLLALLESREIKGQFVLIAPPQSAPAAPQAASDPAALGLLKERLRTDARVGEYLSRLEDAVIVADLRAAVDLWLRYPACNYVTVKGEVLLSSGLLRSGDKSEGFFSLNQDIKRLEENILH